MRHGPYAARIESADLHYDAGTICRPSETPGETGDAKKERMMEINKEVAINASPEDVWSYLTERRKSAYIWSSKPRADFKKGSLVRFSGSKETLRVRSIKPPLHFSLGRKSKTASITTNCDLVPRGKRTILKVAISGWEMMDQEEARKEVPRISLEWEKRLNLIKRTIESAQQASVKQVH